MDILILEDAIEEMEIKLMSKGELKKYNPIKPPFSYYGAKNKIAKKIIELFPPHNAWIEAFCGSAAITLSKKPAPIEIINDMDDQIVNLFNHLRNNRDELIKAIELTPYARSEYLISKLKENNISELEKARRFLVNTMMAVNGAYGNTQAGFSYSQSYSRNGKEARVNRWNNLPDRLSEVARRLKNVRVENRNAIELIKMFYLR